MTGAAIVCCEIGFWSLLVLTMLVLRAGARPDWTHGLAAVYLGFSIAFICPRRRPAGRWAGYGARWTTRSWYAPVVGWLRRPSRDMERD